MLCANHVALNYYVTNCVPLLKPSVALSLKIIFLDFSSFVSPGAFIFSYRGRGWLSNCKQTTKAAVFFNLKISSTEAKQPSPILYHPLPLFGAVHKLRKTIMGETIITL